MGKQGELAQGFVRIFLVDATESGMRVGRHQLCGWAEPVGGKPRKAGLQLLPKFGGQGMYGDHVHTAVLAAKETRSGCTVHFVDDDYDKGAIILQKEVAVDAANDSVEALRNRVQSAEKLALIEVIAAIRDGHVKLG